MEQETRRHQDYPEEYTKGKVTFFGREFQITPDVLIPRLDTEGLVRRACQIIREQNIHTVIDIGCGSGIIGISCADLVDEVIFLDISPEALEVTQTNFQMHFPLKKGECILSDLLSALPSHISEDLSGVLFLANLPYIKGGDWEHMSADTHFEPELALFGGEKTGFEIYERLFGQLSDLDSGSRILIEFGFDQREIAEEIIKQYGWKYEFFADYAGIERFCEIRFD